MRQISKPLDPDCLKRKAAGWAEQTAANSVDIITEEKANFESRTGVRRARLKKFTATLVNVSVNNYNRVELE